MFDANMRYIPANKMFFAEVRGTLPENHPLAHCGTRVFLCKMLTKGHKNPSVEFQYKGGTITLSDSGCGTGAWIVYAGLPNGEGFIHDDVKAECMALLDALKST